MAKNDDPTSSPAPGVDRVRAAREAMRASATRRELPPAPPTPNRRLHADPRHDPLKRQPPLVELYLYPDGFASDSVAPAEVAIVQELAKRAQAWYHEKEMGPGARTRAGKAVAQRLTRQQELDFEELPEREKRAAVYADPTLHFRLPQRLITPASLEGAFARVRKANDSLHRHQHGWSDYLLHVLAWTPRALHEPRMLFQAVTGSVEWREKLLSHPQRLAPPKALAVFLAHHRLATEEFFVELAGLSPCALAHIPEEGVTPAAVVAARRAAQSREFNVDVDALVAKRGLSDVLEAERVLEDQDAQEKSLARPATKTPRVRMR